MKSAKKPKSSATFAAAPIPPTPLPPLSRFSWNTADAAAASSSAAAKEWAEEETATSERSGGAAASSDGLLELALAPSVKPSEMVAAPRATSTAAARSRR